MALMINTARFRSGPEARDHERHNTMKRLLLATAALGITASAAQATTFTFNDE